ncbi:sensor domain-containing diguanylate cyclase [Desulfotalea psychrophila]|uniref:diguanylate cyclase n=1 Tax=Desulfotalea psychrophila (strain LSv54 / DSM 12343) TaxID=177439 RepID=Q6AR33_DESPS|nr:sensor domain-containing diguanylate cyclase [Desulfotalea psychrophila]CAG35191.1 conserved hypothetical protein [Desulfotalea psychrophila LSv54]
MNNKKYFLVGVLTLLLLLGFITTCFVSYYVAHKSISEQIAKTTLPLTSDNIYSEIQRDLLRPIFISSLMANDTFVRDWAMEGEQNEEAIIKYLSEIQKRYGTVSCFFVSEKTGRYYHPEGVIRQISPTDSQDQWYYRLKKIKERYEVNVDVDSADKKSMVIFINYQMYDYSGNYIGATGVGLEVNSVIDLINTYQNRYGRRVFFADMEGNIRLRSSQDGGPKNIRQLDGISAHTTRILTTPSSSISYKRQGKTVYLNSRFVPEFKWILLVEQVEDPLETRLFNTLMINLGISLIITGIILFFAYLTIGGYQRKLEEMATTDSLTGIANRQIFDILFNQMSKHSRRQGWPLSAIMFDLDHFKKINDSYGHPAGDLILKAVSQIAQNILRDSDILCRWGGEEFLILLPNCNTAQAQGVAEKIRQGLETASELIYNQQLISITASFGLTTLQDYDSKDELIKRADIALYAAKENGRNRVEVAQL